MLGSSRTRYPEAKSVRAPPPASRPDANHCSNPPHARTLHQLRHSRLTHLAEAGIALPILMAKSRHTSLSSLGIYAKPTFDAVAAAPDAIDLDRRR